MRFWCFSHRHQGSYNLPGYIVPALFFYVHYVRPTPRATLTPAQKNILFIHTMSKKPLIRDNFVGGSHFHQLFVIRYLDLSPATTTRSFKIYSGISADVGIQLNGMMLRRSHATNMYRLFLSGKICDGVPDDRFKLMLGRQMNTSPEQLAHTYISTEIPEEANFGQQLQLPIQQLQHDLAYADSRGAAAGI